MSCEVLGARFKSKLLVAFLHRLRRRVEAVPRLTVVGIVLVNELQERAESWLLEHAHQI